MKTKYNPERAWPRLVPKNAITVSVFTRELGQAYGLITNISEAGCCFDTGVHFEPGSRVLLRIRFQPETDPLTIESDVVWSHKGKGPKSYIHGVRFLVMEDEQKRVLRASLESTDFHPPASGAEGKLGAGDLEHIVSDLGDDLARLGSKLGKKGNGDE